MEEGTAVSKRLGKMEMVVENLRTFQESCGLMMQSHYCNPHEYGNDASYESTSAFVE